MSLPIEETHSLRQAAPQTGTSSGPGRWALAAALLYVAAHLPFVPAALEDIDSVNFALGLHDFDPLRHQPHPPGYPVYILLGKISRAAVHLLAPGLDAQATDAIALAAWSVAGGAAAILLAAQLLALVGRLGGVGDAGPRTIAAVILLATCSLFWISGLRPLSDMPGLAAALAAQVLLLRACAARERRGADVWTPLAAGACVAGVAVGLRSQVLWLVGAILVLTVVWLRSRGPVRAGALAAGCFGLGALAWAVPLVAESGGLPPYLAALDRIADEDFTSVQMLWTHPTPRRLGLALSDTFVTPWGSLSLAAVVLALAAAGGCLMALRERRALAWLAVLFGPYLLSHLLFQDTPTTRYALPLVVPTAWAAAAALMRAGVRVGFAGAAVVALASLAISVPVVRAYAEAPLPANVAVARAVEGLSREGGVIGGHFEFARSLRVSGAPADAILPSPEFSERIEIVRYWRGGGRGPVWFVASPARTGLDLIDPVARRVVFRSAWRFPRDWFLGGIRPTHADLVRIDSPPGWVAGEGWHLTRQELILSDRRAMPSATMHVARRPDAVTLLLGGTYLADPAAGDAEITVTLDGRHLLRIALRASSPDFREQVILPAGSLSGAGPLASLDVTWRSAGPSEPRVHLTQFELQPTDRPFWVYSHGWHDREYDPATERAWRWTSDRAELYVHPAGHSMRLRVSGIAPAGDLGGVPTVAITAGGTRLHELSPNGPFTAVLDVAAATLELAGGIVAIETSRTFVPGERTGSADRRRLGLQVLETAVEPLPSGRD